MQNPCQLISVMKSNFNKIVLVDSTPAILLKRSFHQGSFSLDTSELLLLFQKGLIFLVKLQAVATALSKLWYTTDFFVKILT